MARIYFRCPNCKTKLNRQVDTKIALEEGQSILRIKCQDGICSRCARGMHLVFCAGVEAMSEHDVRKDSELFRIAERVRRQLKLSI